MPSGPSKFPREHGVPIRLALRLRDDLPGPEMRDVGVGEGGAEARHRLDMAQRAHHRGRVAAEDSHHVVGVGRQARALREQVEHPELARHPGVLELEIRIEIDHAVVPMEFAAVDRDGHGRGQEALGGRADLEDGLRIDRRAAALAAHAEALGVDEAVAGDDADGEAGHVESLHPALDVCFELGDQRVDARLHRCRWPVRFLCPRPLGCGHAKRRGRQQRRHDAPGMAKNSRQRGRICRRLPLA